jgi:predicted Zn-dependent protease
LSGCIFRFDIPRYSEEESAEATGEEHLRTANENETKPEGAKGKTTIIFFKKTVQDLIKEMSCLLQS